MSFDVSIFETNSCRMELAACEMKKRLSSSLVPFSIFISAMRLSNDSDDFDIRAMTVWRSDLIVEITAASSFFVPSGPHDFFSHDGVHDCACEQNEAPANRMSINSVFISDSLDFINQIYGERIRAWANE